MATHIKNMRRYFTKGFYYMDILRFYAFSLKRTNSKKH